MQDRKLLNLSEQLTHRRLQTVAQSWAGYVFPKVRLADIFPINNSGISSAHFTFALKSHFDFTLADGEYYPQFAVEFDGQYHSEELQAARDRTKNELCDHFDFPLLRVNDSFLDSRFGQTDMLSWLTNVWFCAREHECQQQTGGISHEDIFDPRFVISHPGASKEFPLWISRGVQGWLRGLWSKQKIPDFGPCHIVVSDGAGTYRALAWILVNDQGGAVSRAVIQAQRFPYGLREGAEELALYGLRSKVQSILDGTSPVVPRQAIQEEAQRLLGKYKLRFGAYLGELRPEM